MTLALLAVLAVGPEWIAQAGGVAAIDGQGNLIAADLRASWVSDGELAMLGRVPTLRQVDLSMTRVTDLGLRSLRTASALEEVNLYYAELITDEGLGAVRGWPRLKRLNLRGTKASDNALEYLSATPELEWLDLGYSQITDSGLYRLAGLTKLKTLVLGGNKLTETGLASISELPAIERLDLGGKQRTDSGLWSVSISEAGARVLVRMTGLKELRLTGATVSAEVVRSLRESLPQCKIVVGD
jgi:Leucine-rich repeat (LRR) protein